MRFLTISSGKCRAILTIEFDTVENGAAFRVNVSCTQEITNELFNFFMWERVLISKFVQNACFIDMLDYVNTELNLQNPPNIYGIYL